MTSETGRRTAIVHFGLRNDQACLLVDAADAFVGVLESLELSEAQFMDAANQVVNLVSPMLGGCLLVPLNTDPNRARLDD